MHTSRRRLAAAAAAAVAGTSLVVVAGPASAWRGGSDNDGATGTSKHVLLISVDGLHQSDLAWWVSTHPSSALAALTNDGTDYSNASTPFPSDSFPGMVGQVTGGNPASTGIYYDDTFNHAVFPAGTTSCSGAAPGGEVAYTEADDTNLGALDAGQGLVPSKHSTDPWADILNMTGNPRDVINPANLPVDASTCKPIYPNDYLKVNTIFEVAHQAGLATAWSDKHPAYLALSGPSGHGVSDYFTPEINSSANPAAPTDPNQPDWTTDNLKTQQYDGYKVQAVLNWIDGHFHNGQGHLGTPAIFGMNFQTVSTAEKLPTSNTEGDTSGTAKGGYLADGFTPGPVLTNALQFVDTSIGRMTAELGRQGLLSSTTIIVSAKHGQSPTNPAALNRIDDGKIIDALNASWKASHNVSDDLVVFGVNDDGMLLWVNNKYRTQANEDWARNFLAGYDDSSASVDGKPVTSAGLTQIYAGAASDALFNVPTGDPRAPDITGIAQYGVVYTGHKGKIAEHGGDHTDDRNVPIVVAGPTAAHGVNNTAPVETTQIAPTILRLLGLSPYALQAVRQEGTQPLP